MKYLKKFNEELDPMTYRRAAAKIIKRAEKDPFYDMETAKASAEELRNWASKREDDETIVKWHKNIEEFKKYGKIKANINGKVGDFYLNLTFDRDATLDQYEDTEGSELNIGFFIGLIPVDESTKDKFMDEFDDFGNGFFWASILNIKFSIESGTYKFEKIEFFDYGDSVFKIADAPSSKRVKKLIIDLFNNPTLNYPSGYTDYEYFYELFEEVVIPVVSGDTGITMEAIAEEIKKIGS
jgi:hypothetical protein